MKKDLSCPYSIIDRDIICEHKRARVDTTDLQKLHNHDGYEIVLFLEGDVNIQIESDLFRMERGDMFFISPLTFHGIDLSDIQGYERVVINIRYEYLKGLEDDETDFGTFFQSSASSSMNHIRLSEDAIRDFLVIATHLEESLTDTCYGHTVLSKAYLAEFLILASKYAQIVPAKEEVSMMPAAVSRIFDYIEAHLRDEITINRMADDLHYSSDHLSRAFREATGGSLKHYINAKKVALAQVYLRQNYSPYEVCYMVGYNNYSSFSRRFSEQIGMSPKRFQLDSRQAAAD